MRKIPVDRGIESSQYEDKVTPRGQTERLMRHSKSAMHISHACRFGVKAEKILAKFQDTKKPREPRTLWEIKGYSIVI